MNVPSEDERPRLTRVAAYGIVVEDGRILLCRLSPLVARDAGRWTLPGGGLDHGEDPRSAADREVFEETGLHVRGGAVLETDSRLVELPGALVHSIRIVYRVEVLGGELTPELDGSTDMCAWFTRGEALALPLVDLAQLGIALAFDR